MNPNDLHTAPTSRPMSRREWLLRSGLGLGSLGLAALGMGARAALGDSPFARPSPRPARAKRVIQFFLNGGPSHIDTFDPKPMLAKYAGREIPGGNLPTERKTGAAFPSPFAFTKSGESGIEVSEIFPFVASQIDKIAVIRSMKAAIPNHEPSLMLMNCGDAVQSRPSMGSWITYGLGSENENLPGFIAMCPGGYPIKATENWRAGFLPGAYQGTFIDPQHESVDRLIENIRSDVVPRDGQRQQLDLLTQINEAHRRQRMADDRLDARQQSFELAFRMQMEASDVFDVSKEPESIRKMYGDGVHARQALIARRLVERGVRFVQLWHGAGQPWDSHDDIEVHRTLARQCDQSIGALLMDLEQRGLLEDTLVICGGEFGRTPTVELKQSGDATRGRDHNPYGFTVWLAGGGVRGGTVHGATDEFGFQAVEDVVEVH
ncbi:MAG: DUF1501 domain-containing protein, partial [Planctomycetota bacterium]